MSERSIDDIIKEALEKIESDPRTADWGSFESSLDEHELSDMDEYVKSNLEKIQPASVNAWHTFEDKFAEEIGQSHPVDKTVKENLAGHEAAYSESSWYRLSSLLDLTDRRERDLLIRKISEVLTVSLILFILIPQFFLKTNKAKPATDSLQYAHQQNSNGNIDDILQPLTPQKTQKSSVTSINEELLGISSQVSFQNQNGQLTFSDLPVLSGSVIPEKADNHFALTPLPSKQWSLRLSHFYGLRSVTISKNTTGGESFGNIDNSSHSQPMTNLADASTDQLEINEQLDSALNRLPGLALFPLMTEEEDLRSEIEIIELRKEKSLSLATLFSPKLTHIYTPFDDVYDNEAYGRLKVFSDFGLAVEKRKGDVSTGGSISYGSMSYRPPAVVEAYGGNIAEVNADSITGGYRSLSLANIEVSMASISIFLRNFYPLTQNLRWFSHFGGGVNMVLSTDYYVQDIIDHSNGTFTERTYEFDNNESSAATDHAKLHQKNFEGGILEGGNFNTNSYMDIELGAGLEYDLNDQSSVYIASILNLSPFNDGLGPNRDRVNNLDLKIGFKYWL